MGPRPRYADIIAEDFDFRERRKGKKWDTATVQLKFTGGWQAARAVLILTIEDASKHTSRPAHVAQLVFSRADVSNLKVWKCDVSESEEKEDTYMVIEFKTTGGYGFGLDHGKNDFDLATRSLLDVLSNQCAVNLKDGETIPLSIAVQLRQEDRESEEYLTAINTFVNADESAWRAYSNNNGQPNIQIGQIFTRDKFEAARRSITVSTKATKDSIPISSTPPAGGGGANKDYMAQA